MSSVSLSFSFIISFIIRFLFGQIISFAISCTGAFSTLLIVNGKNSSLPILQCILSYLTVCLIWGAIYLIYVFRHRKTVNEEYCFKVDKNRNNNNNNDKINSNNLNNNDKNVGFIKTYCEDNNNKREIDIVEDGSNKKDNNNDQICLNDGTPGFCYGAMKPNATIPPKTTMDLSCADSYGSNINISNNNFNVKCPTGQAIDGGLDKSNGCFSKFVNWCRSSTGDCDDNKGYKGVCGTGNRCFFIPSTDNVSNDDINATNATNATNANNYNNNNNNTRKRVKSVLKLIGQYALVAIFDLEATYITVLAYQYTDLTSVQLLDSCTVPFVAILSYFLLKPTIIPVKVDEREDYEDFVNRIDYDDKNDKNDINKINGVNFKYEKQIDKNIGENNSDTNAVEVTDGDGKTCGIDNKSLDCIDNNDKDNNGKKYRYYTQGYEIWNFIGIIISIAGIVILVIFDMDGMNRTSSYLSTGDVIKGDIFVIIGSLLYALSNVFTERILTNNNSEEEEEKEKKEEKGEANQTVEANEAEKENGEDDDNIINKDVKDNHESINNSNNNKIIRYSWLNPFNCGKSKAAIPPLFIVVLLEYMTFMSMFGFIFGVCQFFAAGEYKLLPIFSQRVEMPCTDPTTLTNASSPHLLNSDLTSKNCSYYDSDVTAFADVANGVDYSSIGYLIGYVLSSFTCYTFIPVLFIISSATFGNLSFLTADFYSIIFNVALFAIYPLPYFILPYLIIVIGIVLYDTNGIESFRAKAISYFCPQRKKKKIRGS